MNNCQLINQSSGEFEYYTPQVITDLAHEVMGGIDLDPASCEIANQRVNASQFFNQVDDGLSQQWYGRVFMNHPFHRGEKACKKKCVKVNCKKPTKANPNRRGHCITEEIPSNMDWVNKFIDSYRNGDISEGICITFASMSESWLWGLLDYPVCYPKGRIHYYKPDGTQDRGAPKGSIITYLGPNVRRFAESFAMIGKVHVPYGTLVK